MVAEKCAPKVSYSNFLTRKCHPVHSLHFKKVSVGCSDLRRSVFTVVLKRKTAEKLYSELYVFASFQFLMKNTKFRF